MGVEGGLASRWGGGKRQVGVSRPCAVEFFRLHRGLQQLTWALGDTALQWGGTTQLLGARVWELEGGWQVSGEAVGSRWGSLEAAPASFCVCVGAAAAALGARGHRVKSL